jgi:hypothetical protein
MRRVVGQSRCEVLDRKPTVNTYFVETSPGNGRRAEGPGLLLVIFSASQLLTLPGTSIFHLILFADDHFCRRTLLVIAFAFLSALETTRITSIFFTTVRDATRDLTTHYLLPMHTTCVKTLLPGRIVASTVDNRSYRPILSRRAA